MRVLEQQAKLRVLEQWAKSVDGRARQLRVLAQMPKLRVLEQWAKMAGTGTAGENGGYWNSGLNRGFCVDGRARQLRVLAHMTKLRVLEQWVKMRVLEQWANCVDGPGGYVNCGF